MARKRLTKVVAWIACTAILAGNMSAQVAAKKDTSDDSATHLYVKGSKDNVPFNREDITVVIAITSMSLLTAVTVLGKMTALSAN